MDAHSPLVSASVSKVNDEDAVASQWHRLLAIDDMFRSGMFRYGLALVLVVVSLLVRLPLVLTVPE